jgi:hypothetical protein
MQFTTQNGVEQMCGDLAPECDTWDRLNHNNR